MNFPNLVLLCVLCIVPASEAMAQLATTEPATAPKAPAHWAVIVVGMPGDDEHAVQFVAATTAWRQWLTQKLDFAPEHVVVCQGSAADDTLGSKPATREAIAEQFQEFAARLRPADSLWLFLLGHGDFDGTDAHLHLPGADPDAADVAQWLAPLPCQQQVLWLTQACSGAWLPRLSRPGRIIVTATAGEDESNETELPYALATVAARSPRELDANSDQRVTFDELLVAVVRETQQRFDADQRLPTEHAMLDDNGDAKGTEFGIDPDADQPPDPALANVAPDGEFSRTLHVPYRPELWEPPAAASPGNDPVVPANQ